MLYQLSYAPGLTRRYSNPPVFRAPNVTPPLRSLGQAGWSGEANKSPGADDFAWGCSSAGRAPALQAGGLGFEPPHLHNEKAL